MIRVGTIAATLVVGILGGVTPAHASDVVIPIDMMIREGVEDEQVELVSIAGTGIVGSTCSVESVRRNVTTTHPRSDLIVLSGDTQALLLDVERSATARTEGDQPILIGDTVQVRVRLGPDGAFEGGMRLELTCDGAARPQENDGATEGGAAQGVESSAAGGSGRGAGSGEQGAAGTGGPGVDALPETGSTSKMAIVASVLVLLGTVLKISARRGPATLP